MKIINNGIIPFKGYNAINLFGVVYTKVLLTDVQKNHEAIHTEQMKWMGYVPFYIWYLLEYFIKLPFYGFKNKKAYYAISFEREALNNEKDMEYTKTRKPYGWFKYLFKNK